MFEELIAWGDDMVRRLETHIGLGAQREEDLPVEQRVPTKEAVAWQIAVEERIRTTFDADALARYNIARELFSDDLDQSNQDTVNPTLNLWRRILRLLREFQVRLDSRQVHSFETKGLPVEPDHIAPDGSDVRILLDLDKGGLAHFEIGSSETSAAVAHRTVEEIWYFIAGRGEMWRKLEGREEVVPVEPGVCITIPAGTHFQFRSFGPESLSAIGVTMPPWPGEGESYEVSGKWAPALKQSRQLNAPEEEIHAPWTESEALELWKYFGSVGAADKNTMVTVVSWLLGLSAAIIGYILTNLPLSITDSFKGISLSFLGIVISYVSGRISLLYGGYSNWNWAKADEVAREFDQRFRKSKRFPKSKWSELLPETSKEDLEEWTSGKHSFHTSAMKLGQPCDPRTELAPIFVLYTRLALFSAFAHLVVFLWSIWSL